MKILGKHILENPYVEKTVLFSWIQQILVQLQAREQTKGPMVTITPFHLQLQEYGVVIIGSTTADEGIPNSIMERFIPDKGQNSCIYSFGRTLQFLFAKSNIEPKLNRREEAHFQKIISRCLTDKSKKQFQTFSQIELQLPKRRKRLFVILTIMAMAVSCIGFHVDKQEKELRKQEEIFYEQGLEYFLLYQDYEQSEEKFRQIKNKKDAVYFAEMAAFLAGKSLYNAFDMEIILKEADRIEGFCDGTREKACLVRVYEKVDTPNARRQIQKLVKEILADTTYHIVREEMRQILARIYMREGEYENALREYKVILEESEYEKVYVAIEEIKKRTH